MEKEKAKEIGIFAQARMTKIKIGKEIHIEYEVQHGESVDIHVLESIDEPISEFRTALQKLDSDVCEICELGEEEKPRIKVHGISLSYKGQPGKLTMGAVITASRRLKRTNLSMLINTPYLPEAPLNKKKQTQNDSTPKLPPSAATQIYIIIDEARKYLNGIRAQTKMEFRKKTDEKPSELHLKLRT